ncbi:peroxisomal leader peptide-processing protease [Puma concolor]|uniref:Peroxisomal leader peptide-processing protease n=1 Tax=Puma concolor TaxID=9696 RepID=A0A6P6HCZ3_PUMCO|nr:peroxisomal leader peptide-processing protease [Puma concolor]
MARQWGPSMRAAERAGCVVSASRAGQPEAGSWSCSGVILSRCPDLVLCHGGIFTPFLRAGSGALSAAGAAFLPGDSCGDDLRLHVQRGPAASSPSGRAERGRPGLCTPQCAGPESGPQGRPRGRPLQPPRPAELLLLLSCPAFRAHFARLFGGEAAEQWRFASAAPEEEVTEDEEEDQLRALGWFALLRVRPDSEEEEEEEEEERGPAVAVASAAIWGQVVFATQETSPYDIAVVSLEEDLPDVSLPVPAEHFHEGEAVSVVGFGVFGQACGPSVTSGILSAVVQVDDTPVMLQTTCAVHGGSSGGPLFSTRTGDLLGIVASNTRDNNTGATYPHLNFSIPITVLQPALQRYSQMGDLGSLRELDSATEPVRVVWRLQRPLAEAPRSKL